LLHLLRAQRLQRGLRWMSALRGVCPGAIPMGYDTRTDPDHLVLGVVLLAEDHEMALNRRRGWEHASRREILLRVLAVQIRRQGERAHRLRLLGGTGHV
jgi:hypothetical protein